MPNNILAPESVHGALIVQPTPPDLVAMALSGVGKHTLRAYQADYRHFSAWAGMSSPEEAARRLISQGQGPATAAVWTYRQHCIDSGQAPQTINRRLASLRHLVRALRRAGVILWSLEIQGVKSTPIRDTRGPGAAAMRLMLAASVDPQEHLVLRLLHDMALRRAEVVALTVADYAPEPAPARLWVMGKGRLEKEPYTCPDSVVLAVDRWLVVRGDAPGSLTGVGYSTIPRIVQRAALRAGACTHPHGLRHAGITKALNATNGNIRMVQKFARHADPATTAMYDDDRTDAFGECAGLVGEGE